MTDKEWEEQRVWFYCAMDHIQKEMQEIRKHQDEVDRKYGEMVYFMREKERKN